MVRYAVALFGLALLGYSLMVLLATFKERPGQLKRILLLAAPLAWAVGGAVLLLDAAQQGSVTQFLSRDGVTQTAQSKTP